jgi:hypothetical protein
MKNVSLTVASVLLAGILTAQEYTPTSSMTSAFSAKYPQGLVEEWYDNDDEIICYFGNGDTYGTAYFTLKGAWTRSPKTNYQKLFRQVSEPTMPISKSQM